LGLIVLSVCYNGALFKILRPLVPAIRWAGLLTYPLYLLHQRAGYLLIAAMRSSFGDTTSFLLVTSLMLVAAFLIAMYGEPPLRKQIRLRVDRLRQTWFPAPA